MLNKISKRGISPVVATVILVTIVIVIIVIIFIWARSVIQPAIEKFGEPIKRACDRIDWTANLDGSTITITNNGEVAIYNVKISSNSGGDKETKDYESPIELTQGQSTEIDIADYRDVTSISPIIRGKEGNTDKDYTCSDKEIDFS